MKIYFLSSNPCKIDEVQTILNSEKIEILSAEEKINEIQSEDMIEIVKDKALKAFSKVGRNILVEQTGVFIDDFGGLPGGLTQIFWDALQADKFSEYFSHGGTAQATARTVLAYCDGKHIYTFEGEIKGKIVNPPRGNRNFQWDCVFQPEGKDQTFAEMGELKNDISMRKIALEKFRTYLEER